MPKPVEVSASVGDIGTKAPRVTITMDVWAWDFILESISLGAQNDELVKIIRKSCRDALAEWLPNVHKDIK